MHEDAMVRIHERELQGTPCGGDDAPHVNTMAAFMLAGPHHVGGLAEGQRKGIGGRRFQHLHIGNVGHVQMHADDLFALVESGAARGAQPDPGVDEVAVVAPLRVQGDDVHEILAGGKGDDKVGAAGSSVPGVVRHSLRSSHGSNDALDGHPLRIVEVGGEAVEADQRCFR